MARLAGGDAISLWFCSDAFLWRYDVKTRSIQSWSALDGLPMPGSWPYSPFAVGRLGSCAVPIRKDGVYRWTRQDGWQVLPFPAEGDGPWDIRFDGKGELLATTSWTGKDGTRGTAVWQWRDGGWREAAHAEHVEARRLCPVEGGWLLAAARNVFLLDQDGQAQNLGGLPPPPPEGSSEGFISLIPLDGRVLCSTDRRRFEYSVARRELRPLDANVVGVDQSSGGYIRRILGADKTVRLVAEDGAAADFPFPDEVLDPVPVFRDAGKDFWIHDRRWDGKRWAQVAPDGQMSQLPWSMNQPWIVCQDVLDRSLWQAERLASRHYGGLQLLKVRDWQVTVVKSWKSAGTGSFMVHLRDGRGRLWGTLSNPLP
jgi:hypothetical protein